MGNAAWRIECHIWFENREEYNEREEGLLRLLKKTHGDDSVTVFFRDAPEYLEIPGASYDHADDGWVSRLMDFCGRNNVDFVARISRDTGREPGCIRGMPVKNGRQAQERCRDGKAVLLDGETKERD